MIVGRALLIALGGSCWTYALKPQLPVVRSLPYFWRGNLPLAPEWRVFAALVGTVLVIFGALIGPPFMR